MFKQCLLVLIAAGLILIAAPFAAAQDRPSNDRQSSPLQNSAGRHLSPDPALRVQKLTAGLGLSSDQQSKVKDIFESEHSQMESLRQDASLSQHDRYLKSLEIHARTHAQIRGLLDSAQLEKWDGMRAQHRQAMQNR